MHSSAKVFSGFINWLISLGFLTEEQLLDVLDEFGGVPGVLESCFYISAYEEIARYLAHLKSLDEMVCFVELNNGMLSDSPGEQYYFVESLVDVYSAVGLDVSGLINASPMCYRNYLINRFG
jgi:hypothetical protein